MCCSVKSEQSSVRLWRCWCHYTSGRCHLISFSEEKLRPSWWAKLFCKWIVEKRNKLSQEWVGRSVRWTGFPALHFVQKIKKFKHAIIHPSSSSAKCFLLPAWCFLYVTFSLHFFLLLCWWFLCTALLFVFLPFLTLFRAVEPNLTKKDERKTKKKRIYSSLRTTFYSVPSQSALSLLFLPSYLTSTNAVDETVDYKNAFENNTATVTTLWCTPEIKGLKNRQSTK